MKEFVIRCFRNKPVSMSDTSIDSKISKPNYKNIVLWTYYPELDYRYINNFCSEYEYTHGERPLIILLGWKAFSSLYTNCIDEGKLCADHKCHFTLWNMSEQFMLDASLDDTAIRALGTMNTELLIEFGDD